MRISRAGPEGGPLADAQDLPALQLVVALQQVQGLGALVRRLQALLQLLRPRLRRPLRRAVLLTVARKVHLLPTWRRRLRPLTCGRETHHPHVRIGTIQSAVDL